MRRGDDKSVAYAGGEPFLQPVGHFLGAADERLVGAGTVTVFHELPRCRVLDAGRCQHPVPHRLGAGDVVQLVVGERLIHALGGEVEVHGFRQQRQRVDLGGQALGQGGLVLGFHFRFGANDIGGRRDDAVVGIAALGGDGLLDLLIVLAAEFQRGRAADEQQLTPAGGELLAAAALAGLDYHWMALFGAWHGERPARLEEFALVVDAAHLIAMREQAGFLVLHDGIVIPGRPMAHDDFHELIGAIVTTVVFGVDVLAHVQGLAVVHRGDDVPGGAPVGHQIDGGERARDIERFVIGRAARGPEAQPLGGHAHDHHDGHGVHFHAADAVFDGVAVVVAVAVRHREAVIEEGHLEFAGFQHPAEIGVIFRAPGIRAGFRMPPGAYQVRAVLGLQEAHHYHLSLHGRLRYQKGASPQMVTRCITRVSAG